MSAANHWFLLDEVGDEVLIHMPDGRLVKGRIVGRFGRPETPPVEAFDLAAILSGSNR